MNKRDRFLACCLFVVFPIQFLFAEEWMYPDARSKAENAKYLHLFPEPGQIRGWISGISERDTSLFAEIDGKEQRVSLDAEGRFLWKGSAEKVTLVYGELSKTVTLPNLEEPKPVAFFVVDRSVYRPDSKLQYAAFLREKNEQGLFVPLANKEATVVLTSKAKGIHIDSQKLQSDDFGRINGGYTFTPSDPLDDYQLHIKEFAGVARLKLAEFRKAKVRVEIGHEQTEPETMKLTFKALDYQDKTVGASSVQMEALVRRIEKPEPDLWGLNPENFADSESQKETRYALSKEQLARSEAGFSVFPKNTAAAVHQIVKKLPVDPNGEASFFLALDPTWKFHHVLDVRATIIDQNEREQRATRKIPLSPPPHPNMKLELSDSEVTAGVALDISIETPPDHRVSLVSFRLEERQSSIGRSPIQWGNQFGNRRPNSNPYQDPPPTREFLSVAFPKPGKAKNHYTSKLQFAKPGAYLVQALARDAEGNEVATEQTVVVKSSNRASGLFLKLDHDRIKAGQALQGEIHSRYDGAEVLLVLRDGNGVRKLVPVIVDQGVAEFKISLPEPITLGCELSARYWDEKEGMQYHRRSFAVEPGNAKLKITSQVPQKVDPGSEVELEFSVDRKEVTDLVVSVYDQSLLGIAPDRGVDGSSFFCADVRVERDVAMRVLGAYLGDLSPQDVVAEMIVWLEENKLSGDSTEKERARWNAVQNLRSSCSGNQLYLHQILGLMDWKGVPVRYFGIRGWGYGGLWYLQKQNQKRWESPIVELIAQPGRSQNTELIFTVAGDQIICEEVYKVNGQRQFFSSRGRNFSSIGHVGSGLRSGGMMFGDITVIAGGEVDFFNGGMSVGSGFNGGSISGGVGGNGSWSASAQAGHSHLNGPMLMAAPNQGQGDQHAAGIASLPIRRDFSDSAFFNARVRTDQEGKAKVMVPLPDSLTHWEVVVTGVTQDLAIGRHRTSFETHRAVMVWPMLSQGFTAGDQSDVFALVHNHTERAEEFTVSAYAKNGAIHGESEKIITIEPNSEVPVYFTFEAGKAGFTELLMSVTSSVGNDASLKKLPVFPCKSEQVITRSGFAKDVVDLTIPKDIDLEQSRLDITISPSLAGDMLDSLDYLIAYPHGCVEQTMSRFLPTIKVTQILRKFEIEDEKLKKTAPIYAKAGIKRLLELQKPDGGWGWQGNGAIHEMMTPYALYGLIEAEKAGFEIPNEDAIERGMKRLGQFIDSMGDRQSADRIYCMWVYQHHKELKKEWWTWLDKMTKRTLSVSQVRADWLSDYGAAMALEMAAKRERTDLQGRLVQLLIYRARGTGSDQAYWTTANFSRWGNDRFEITAAVLKALVAHNPDHDLVAKTLNFFARTKRGNKWNSTKDTAMILYAMCDYLETQNLKKGEENETVFTLNGEEHRIKIHDWQPGTISIEGEKLRSGEGNQIAFLKSRPDHLYRLVFRHWKNGREIEAVDEGVSVERSFSLIDPEGEVIRELESGESVPRGSLIKSILKAKCDTPLTYTLAVNPKPSSAEYSRIKGGNVASNHVLVEERASGVFWHHEQAGPSLQNAATYRVELTGDFLIPPGYVELMYDTATRGSTSSFRLQVTGEKDRVHVQKSP